MSKTPGIGSSREDRPTSEYTFPTGSSASPYGTVVQETVLNPEGRRLAGAESSSFVSTYAATDASPVDSQVWKRLFPVEADPSGISDFDAPTGCELGHFLIEERIGSGGMGAVFRALDQRLQRVVALKVLSPGQSRDRASVLRFQNEARSAARLDHENVARVHYVGEDRGLHFIAFEYVTGQNVRDLIARTGRLGVADAVNFTLQIAAALRHTAAAGVVHRDIKPSNIIIAPNGRAKLVDLGLARKLAADSTGDLTVAGTTLGTFDYISPEQARDPRNVDVRSDIYSLGCTLYHMLTGSPPYSSGTVLQKLLDHQSGQAPDPRAINPQVPPALSALCRKMMAGDPKNRVSTPDELIRELAAIAAGLGLRPMPAEGYIWSRPASVAPPKIRSGLIWAGSAAVVLLLALLVDRPSSVEKSIASRSDSGADSRLTRSVEKSAVADISDDRTSPTRRDFETADSRRDPLTAPPLQDAEPVELANVRKDEPGPSSQPSNTTSTLDSASAARIDVANANSAATRAPSLNIGSTSPDSSSPRSVSRDAVPLPKWMSDAFEGVRALGGALADIADASETPVEPVDAVAPSSTASEETTEPLPYGSAMQPFVLRPNNGEREFGEYASLADAVWFANSGDTIELHFNGRAPGLKPSEPFLIDGKTLTIRAGVDEQGQPYRPVVEFLADPKLAKPSQMIRVEGERGGLSLQGVELAMTIAGEARSVSGQWSLFSLSETQQVRLRDVGITVVNAKEWPGVSVFDLRPPDGVTPQNNEMNSFMDSGRAQGFTVELDDCFVRGKADFMTVAHTRPGRLTLRNSAFALESALLNVTGGIEQPPAGDALRVELIHVTTVVGDALLRLDVGTLPRYATAVHATVRDSVFATSSTGPLVVMTGNAAPTTFLEMLEWNGTNNVFDGFSEYWSILTEAGSDDSAPHTFLLWTDHWKRLLPSIDASETEQAISPHESLTSIWAKSWEAKKTNKTEVTAADLGLDPRAGNVDLEATDGPERRANALYDLVGAAIDELPRFSYPPVGITSTEAAASSR
ncbi:MAG: protein kinase [Planctomycetaceae bacterium]|nr:protein kinase [Planctomycetaceae bacterium]